MITRNPNKTLSKRNQSPAQQLATKSTGNDDYFLQLPDLSGLREEEKRHILDVLVRDESLRKKHLSRFGLLKREVSELEEKFTPYLNTACSLCQTPFGFLFNTGDTCPKCAAKVCKQCRLMYNVNDNGWLCKLCCKQMQLMSYSGEWVYSTHSNLRKDSVTASEMIRKSLSRPTSIRNLNNVSSSDTETETSTSNLGHGAADRSTSIDSHDRKLHRMMVQTISDERKLNSVKQSVKKRPNASTAVRNVGQTLIRDQNSKELTASTISSDDVDSLLELSTNYTGRTSRSTSSNLSVQNAISQRQSQSNGKSDESLSRIPNGIRYDQNRAHTIDQRSVDCASVTSSEWGYDDNTSIKVESINQPKASSYNYELKPNVASGNNHESLMSNLPDVSNRMTKDFISTSRSSLMNIEKKSNVDVQDPVRQLEDNQNPVNILYEQETNKIPNEKRSSVSSISSPESNLAVRKFNENSSNRNDLAAQESDEDIDRRFEKAKMELAKRASSRSDFRGSQISITSGISESKANYGLEITGTIQLTLTYSSSTGALDILIHHCQNLARAKRNQTSDPYVKIYLLPDRSKNSKRKSTIKKNAVDPVFEEKFRYHLNRQEFDMRTLWISVWSQSSLSHNDFLGEIHLPLSQCTMDKTEDYKLLARVHKNDLLPNIEPSTEPGEILFQLSFIPNSKNKDIGTLQIHYIEAKGIFYGRNLVDAICKGVLMPDNLKRKLPTIRKGPSPKWEVPLRWDGIRRDNLSNTSIEISIWNQEIFRKTKLSFVRLNLGLGYFDNKPVDWMDATEQEKLAWKRFIQKPTTNHQLRLTLRPVKNEQKSFST